MEHEVGLDVLLEALFLTEMRYRPGVSRGKVYKPRVGSRGLGDVGVQVGRLHRRGG